MKSFVVGLVLGLLFILSVYYFPQGVVGRLRGRSGSHDTHEIAS